MDSEELEALRNKVEGGNCTPLELLNIQMYVALQLDSDGLKRIIEKEIERRKNSPTNNPSTIK